MTRDDLATYSTRYGPRLTKFLYRYLRTKRGQQMLDAAPGIQTETGMRPMTPDEALAALVAEATHLPTRTRQDSQEGRND